MVLVRVRLGDNELRASTRTAVEAKSRWLRRNSGVGLINVHLVGGAGASGGMSIELDLGQDPSEASRASGSDKHTLLGRALEAHVWMAARTITNDSPVLSVLLFRPSMCPNTNTNPALFSNRQPRKHAKYKSRLPRLRPSQLKTQRLASQRPPSRLSSQRASPFHRPPASRAARVDHPLAPTRVHYCQAPALPTIPVLVSSAYNIQLVHSSAPFDIRHVPSRLPPFRRPRGPQPRLGTLRIPRRAKAERPAPPGASQLHRARTRRCGAPRPGSRERSARIH